METDKIEITPEQEEGFIKQYLIGIYESMHKKGMFTDAQLKALIKLNEN
jgi:hypothetical protein